MSEKYRAGEGGQGGRLEAVLLGTLVGSAVQLFQPGLWPGLAYGGLGLVGLVAALLGGKTLRGRARPAGGPALLAWPFVAAAFVCFALCGGRALLFQSQALAPELEGRTLAVTGVVAALPQRNDMGLRFRLEVETAATADGQPVQLPPQLYLGWYGGAWGGAEAMDLQRQPADLRAGDRWRMLVRLKAPHGGSNPHGFDFELWLWEQGLQATGYVRAGPNDPPPQRLQATRAHPVERARQSVHDAVYAQVADPRTAGLLAALVVGDQSAIDRADWDVFRATGVAHLMSISGLHITMFAWAAAWLVGRLWRRSTRLCLAWPAPHAALAGGLVLASAYALFSGWGVPAQRTVIMLAAVGLLRLSGRRWPWPQVWLLAAAVVVAADPWALLQAGFWLSFVAVGVLFASDGAGPRAPAPGSAPLEGPEGPASAGWMQRLRQRLAVLAGGALKEQWTVTLALTPLSVLLFGQVSVVGLLANALAIPWVTLVVTPLALGGVLFAPLWDAAAWAVQALAVYLQGLASMPFAALSLPAPPLWAGAAGLLGGALLALPAPRHLRVLGVPLLLPVLLWQAPRPAPGEFDLLAADVGQGNAVLVRTAGRTLVYDTGARFSRESDAGHRVLVPLLRALGERVDTVVLSHRDSDHTGGAPAVLAMQPQAALLSSIEDGHELQALRPATRCLAGQAWDWDGVHFEILHPRAEDYEAPGKPNGLSCVLRIANGRQAVLLAGDIERAQEARLASEPARLQADVLLVPHHGSKTSSSDVFLDAVRPRLAIVQAGYRNRFGHPAAPVLQRYEARRVQVVDSPRCGAVHWRSDDPRAVGCEREAQQRYWRHRPP